MPMVWYIPPLSPIQSAAESGVMGMDGMIPDVKSLRIPVRYLANLLTAGDEAPVVSALERMLAMRAYQRGVHVDKVQNMAVLQQTGLTLEPDVLLPAHDARASIQLHGLRLAFVRNPDGNGPGNDLVLRIHGQAACSGEQEKEYRGNIAEHHVQYTPLLPGVFPFLPVFP